ncbi:hypothetical protein [Rathayibacter toxicus]|uniref:hypothetical protein n=1 Tax=Rathayibacter toxicus TaxID=145458 RepID=UPI00041C6453|nr:hypothetical protein [Rathayibacter toxicus]QOD08157.1 hypothetical protein AYW78_09980 [Rathayibacter toxicus]QOD10255.1 hypothetical protein BSG36_10155 [Rathayibacter toxicus]QWL26818.1 hypothetical protein E2R32_09815 [Rathayibacter toxicus]QWL28928.1 hypothetical protein E2R33_10175 [Rathayibacter toxicus]QWL31030.1 hypothetical protein E2R34_09950 [Rathayibacter toxicus]
MPGLRRPSQLHGELASDRHLVTWSEDLSVVDSFDFGYADTRIDRENFDAPDYRNEKSRRIAAMMPIHPGGEISDDLVDHPPSIIYSQAENRMRGSHEPTAPPHDLKQCPCVRHASM